MSNNYIFEKHYIIPIFIPQKSCPNQCVFCNQRKITGFNNLPDEYSINNIIENYTSTIDIKNSILEIAFFGGNFTGIEISEQIKYLNIIKNHKIFHSLQGIRVSTRPDYINDEILTILKNNFVKTIELGVQSTDNEVLNYSKRNYTKEIIFKSSYLIKKYGFNLGLQMMIGLPKDNLEKTINTVNDIIEITPDFVRIYPTLVIKDTELENLYRNKLYKPLSLEETIKICKEICLLFEKYNIPIIRLGLHPSEGLLNKTSYIDGPFHQSLKELVYTEIWYDNLKKLMIENKNKTIEIEVNPKELNYAIGYNSKNKDILKMYYKKVFFKTNSNLINRNYLYKIY